MKNIIIKGCLLTIVFLQFQAKLKAQATNKIDSVGNVGIGTTSPTDKLTVEGQIKSGAILMTGWSQSPYSNSTWLRGASGVGVFLTNENVSRWAGLQADGSFDVSHGKLFVDAQTGYVGLNSKSPAHQLFVTAGSKTNSLYVGSASSFSDRSGNGDNIYIRQPLQTGGGWWGVHMAIQGPLSGHTADFHPIRYMTDENNDGFEDHTWFHIDKRGGIFSRGSFSLSTTNTETTLDIKAPAASQHMLSTTTTNVAYTAFRNESGNNGYLYVGKEGLSGGSIISGAAPYAGILGLYGSTAPLQLATNNSVAMTILHNGNIGVGTSTPIEKLHIEGTDVGVGIAGSARSRLNLYTSNQNGWQIEVSNTDGNQYGGDLGFTESGVAGGRLVLKKGGNVGIGLLNPSEKLAVNGNVRAKKVIVSQTGWPDYVFDAEYSLRSLSEVEKFIARNKHLPDMPSAKEVEEKGISVGDNQALLLKKIEELTLYLIEQDKKINFLLAENKKMKAREK